jgi:cold shock CspA family protein
MEGTVKFFEQKGFFGVVQNEGGSWFFHGSAVTPGDSLMKGDSATFDVVDDPMREGRLMAVNVHRIASAEVPTQAGGNNEPNVVFISNMPYVVSRDQLIDLFSEFGTVVSARVVCDRATGQPKGFGFVEMEHDRDALLAIEQLDGKDWDGRSLTVRQARDRQQSRQAAQRS